MQNILPLTNEAIYKKTWGAGLSSYTQSNCQVSLTDDGYRIYRPPNLTVADNGNTMWGGLVIRPFNENANALIKGHTYIIKFEVKGKSSNGISSETYWTNNCGWGGGGLEPQPSNVLYTPLPADFNQETWFPFQYKWTINDNIIKTCTTSYSSFVAGQDYISYRDFKFGFGYTSTGTLGTDLYIRNIRLYDITTKPNHTKALKIGIIIADNFMENDGNISAKVDGDLYSNELIEI